MTQHSDNNEEDLVTAFSFVSYTLTAYGALRTVTASTGLGKYHIGGVVCFDVRAG